MWPSHVTIKRPDQLGHIGRRRGFECQQLTCARVHKAQPSRVEGLPGEVERHFWERFGAAMLISVVNGAVQAGVQAANHSGGAVVYAPTTSQDVMTEVLRSTVNIAPTVVKHNGDRIQVLVARDLDFRSVYELRAPATGH